MKKTKSELDQILIDKFYAMYPKNLLPEWFGQYLHFLPFANKDKNVVQLNIYLQRVFELQKHEYFKEYDLHKVIASHENEKLGINFDYAQCFIFTAYLHKTLDIEIIKSVDLSQLNLLKKEDFVPIDAKELIWRYSDKG